MKTGVFIFFMDNPTYQVQCVQLFTMHEVTNEATTLTKQQNPVWSLYRV